MTTAAEKRTYIDPRGIFRKIVKIDNSQGYSTLIQFECGHIGSMNPIFDYSHETEMHCFECGNEARKARGAQ